MADVKYKQFPISELYPSGWLLDQLKIQAAGQCGNLDLTWPDVRDSAWIGGDREGWERVPYWLDGFIPMALLLRDEGLTARARKYIDAILDRQSPDGWICPVPTEQSGDYDIWACFLIGKVLALWAEQTGDERAADALYRSMKCLWHKLKNGEARIFSWGKSRWFECFIPLLWLWARSPEDWIRELGTILRDGGTDWAACAPLWRESINKWTFETHIVNIAMMLKYEPLCCALTGDEPSGKAEELYRILNKFNGTAVGTFTGDECLGGLGANRGTELCSVVELMYSFEWLFRLTGKTVWLDRLEKCAFNAMPATFTDDMWAHQYDQMVNQIACVKFPGKSFFGTNGKEAHLFGLEPNYGCCTANQGQGWPKLAMNVFLRDGRGVLLTSLLPETLRTVIGGVNAEIAISSDYPFRLGGTVTVTADAPVDFDLSFRVPAWAESCTVNGRPAAGKIVVLGKKWAAGTTSFTVVFGASPRFVFRPYALCCAEYGPLVYSLPIQAEYVRKEYEKDGVLRQFPYCDYELVPRSDWKYGFAAKELIPEERPGDAVPFSSVSPRCVLKAKLAPADWKPARYYTQVAGEKPESHRAMGEAFDAELIPYGCAKLRMTEMPELKFTDKK